MIISRFCLLSLLLLISENAYTSERPHQSLERAFKGETPLFAVSVVRVTPDNDEDYVPLPAEDSLMVFSVLEMLFGYHNQDEFNRKLEETLARDREKFSILARRKQELKATIARTTIARRIAIREIESHRIIKGLTPNKVL